MNTFELNQEEIKNLHNGKYELHGLVESLNGVINSSVVNNLRNELIKIDNLMKDYYEYENQEYEENEKELKKLEKGKNFISVWSCSEIRGKDMKKEYPSEVKEMKYNGLTLKVNKNKLTWFNIWCLCDKLIKKSDDDNHIFIEGFEYNANTKTLSFYTGS